MAAAASRLTRRSRRRDRDGRRDNTGKWVLVCVYVSVAIILTTVGLLTPGVKDSLSRTTTVIASSVFAASFLVFRFRRAVGLPVATLSLLSVVLLLLLLRSLAAFTGETEIGRVRVLSARDGRMRVELVADDREPALVDLEGEYFAPIVKVIVFDDALVFLGSRTWYRFEGLTSFTVEREGAGFRFRQTSTDFYFPQPPGISEGLYRVFERYEGQIPGVKTVQVEVDLKRASQDGDGAGIIAYAIRLQHDGGVEIVRD